MSHRQFVLLLLCLALFATGCATKKYTRSEVGAAEGRITDRVDRQVGDLETQVERNQSRIERNEQAISETSRTAQEALERALAAGKLAEGKLLYETVLSSDAVNFEFDRADLGEQAQQALNQFSDRLKEENRAVYIEIQGHTDASGEESYNLELGEERAEAVRRYLSTTGIPLHRMSVISYGESAPIADNATREGRAKNRRVALVVLE